MAFVVYSFTSSLWSVAPYESAKGSLSLALILAGSCLIYYFARNLAPSDQKFVEGGLIAGGILGFSIIGIEIASDGYLTRLALALSGKVVRSSLAVEVSMRPGMSVAALFIWPWIMQLYRSLPRFAATGIGGAAVGILLLSGANAAVVAIIFGFGVSILAFFLRQKIAVAFIFFMIVGIGIMPLVPTWIPDPLVSGKNIPKLPNSAIHRIAIWQVTSKHIAERPFFGHGFNSARALYGSNTKIYNNFFPDTPERSWSNLSEPIPLHPHNMALQIWLELGLFGAMLFAVILAVIANTCAKKLNDPYDRAAVFGLFSSSLVIAGISFGAWQGWWLSALVLIGGLGVLVLRHKAQQEPRLFETKAP